MDWQSKRIKLYIEAGLALLLVLTLALAGASGILSASADDSGREKERIKAVSEQAADGKNQTAAEETIADGQYPIMGESPVTVQEMEFLGKRISCGAAIQGGSGLHRNILPDVL